MHFEERKNTFFPQAKSLDTNKNFFRKYGFDGSTVRKMWR
jgi:hypothetical protein